MYKKTYSIKQDNGEIKTIGTVQGDTFYSKRSLEKHLYLGGNKSIEQATTDKTASWGIDSKLCDRLLEVDKIKDWIVLIKDGFFITELKNVKEHKESFVLNYKPFLSQYFLQIHVFEWNKYKA